jgi:serine/threonine-protein kinase RsbW
LAAAARQERARELISLKTMASVAHVRLDLVNRPENVPLVRQAFNGFAEAIGLSPVDVHDISTALSEACNNASLHAYDGSEGPLQVELRASPQKVVVSVRDRGRGFVSGEMRVGAPAKRGDDGIAGIGLVAIHGLASQVELREQPGGGTEVVMVFATPSLSAEGLGYPYEYFERQASEPGQTQSTIELDVAPLGVARGVLSRVLRAVAARASFSIDQLGHVKRVGELLFTTATSWVPSGHIQASIANTSESLELGIGPICPQEMSSLVTALLKVEPTAEGSLRVQRNGYDRRLILRLRRLAP